MPEFVFSVPVGSPLCFQNSKRKRPLKILWEKEEKSMILLFGIEIAIETVIFKLSRQKYCPGRNVFLSVNVIECAIVVFVL